MMQDTNSLYLPFLLVMGHLLLLLEFGTSLFPFTIQPMYFLYIRIIASDLNQIIQEDSVLEMTQTQPNMTFLKNIIQCYMGGGS